MTLTPWDLALAAMAAPDPESRLTSSSTLAPLVIACSACCCCVDLSPSAFWMVDSTPALSKACLSSGRSSVSQRTDDLESGSRTATLPGLAPPEPPPPDDPLLLDESSLPHAATASDSPAATVAISHAPLFTELLLMGVAPPPGSARPGRFDHWTQRVVVLGLGEDERDRAEDLGAVAERAGDDGGGLRGARQGTAAERVANAVEQQLPRVREVAADDQQLRVEHVYEHGRRAPDGPAGV